MDDDETQHYELSLLDRSFSQLERVTTAILMSITVAQATTFYM